MKPQPKQFGVEYASIFQDASVVAAYPHRPPYPPATFAALAGLIDLGLSPCRILDAGCGTGQMTAGLLPFVDHVDAVDLSSTMIAAGKQMPYGADPKITWVVGSIEDVPLQPPYTLIVAAASLHWMPWQATLPRFAQVLAPEGYLALVENRIQPSAWADELGPIMARYSLNQDFQPYSMLSIAQELAERGLFQQHGVKEIPPVLFRQPVEHWIDAFHATNGFSRERMTAARTAAFDHAIRQLVVPHCSNGEVEQWVGARVIYGKPRALESPLS